MENIKIYTTASCPYCTMAKNLLKDRGYNFEEITLEFGSSELMELVKKTKQRTVPQIFFGEEFIGGYDNLVEYFNK